MNRTPVSETSKVYLVGGGIASMAAAAFLIRDGDMPGHRITIFEESDVIGGSLDGSGSPETRLCPARRPDAGEQVSVHLRPVRLDPYARRDAERDPGDFRVERDDEDLVEVAPVPRRAAADRAEVRAERASHPGDRAARARARDAARPDDHRRPVRRRVLRTPTSGSCGARPLPSSRGTARSSSSATWCGSRTWSTASTASKASCGRLQPVRLAWSARCASGSTSAASVSR